MAVTIIETWRWIGVGDQHHAPAALPPGSNHSTRCRGRLGGLHGGCGRIEVSNPESSSLLRVVIATREMLAWTYKIMPGCEMG